MGTRTYLLDVALNHRRQRLRTDERCCPSPLLDVLALNVGKDRVQRSSEKFACRLDARSCGIKKVERRYLVAGSLVCKRACSGQLGPHRSVVSTALLDERKCLGLRSPCGPLVVTSFVGRLSRRRLVATALLNEHHFRRRGSAFGSLLVAAALLGDCRTPEAVLLVVQACESGFTLLALRSLAGDPDIEAAAAEPKVDGSSGHLFLLGSKFGLPLSFSDALAEEAKALAKGSSLPLPFSLGDALAEEAKALAKGSSLLLPFSLGDVLADEAKALFEACCASNDANQCPGRYMGGRKGGKQNLVPLPITHYEIL